MTPEGSKLRWEFFGFKKLIFIVLLGNSDKILQKNLTLKRDENRRFKGTRIGGQVNAKR